MDLSIEFYQNFMGFALDWRDETLCSLSRDGHSLMLSSRSEDNNRNSWVWIGLEDDSLIQQLSGRAEELNVLQPPTNSPWAYEMKIADPDDNTIWLATGPKKD